MSDARCCDVCESCARICDRISANSGGGWETFGQAIRSSCTHAGTRQVPVEPTDARDELVNLFFQKCSADGKTLAFSKSDLRAFIDKFMETVNELRPLSAAPQSGAAVAGLEGAPVGRLGVANDRSNHRGNSNLSRVASPAQPAGDEVRPATLIEELEVMGRWHNQPFSPAEEKVRAEAIERLRAAGAAGSRADREDVPAAYIEHHKGGDNLTWGRVDHPYAKATPLYRALRSEQGKGGE